MEQSLLLPQPDQSRLQLRLLLTVPAEKKKEGLLFVFRFYLLLKRRQDEKTCLQSSALVDGECSNTSW